MTRPNIQIDDEVREMTEEEHAQYLAGIAQVAPLEGTDETPTAD
jgi:hypothetical protein